MVMQVRLRAILAALALRCGLPYSYVRVVGLRAYPPAYAYGVHLTTRLSNRRQTRICSVHRSFGYGNRNYKYKKKEIFYFLTLASCHRTMSDQAKSRHLPIGAGFARRSGKSARAESLHSFASTIK